ncbi:DUF3370 domain-containing protein [Pseudanabaena sp. PCC 6802]|uniref:DUF3370 domain-containing protein n=1 Tax=Pseudanabaena sp. PCC 6802 TaxID=118173 RepID=UPI000349C904|nr:DUF3370 domain-containing protein [Pseudanabaena sp. PCC 6802]
MFPLLPTPIAQIAPATTPLPSTLTTPTPLLPKGYIQQTHEIRELPGKLNEVLVFNSNSPEVVQSDGILLSTFPPSGKLYASAHLDRSFSKRFDLFTHHIARPIDGRTIYQGVIVYNPNSETVKLDVLQAVSYLTNPDAPFIDLPPQVENPYGRVYSGPGSRLTQDILRGVNQLGFPSQILIPPNQSRMLLNLPIANGTARSTYMRLHSDRPVYMANLAMQPPSGRLPELAQWEELLRIGRLATPRDRIPTEPDKIEATLKARLRKIYGRVAGVAQGSEWQGEITDPPNGKSLTIPQRGQALSYPLSSVILGTLNTGQVQSAPMVVRYPDTAYRAHGNYGVRYNLTIPLENNTKQAQTVILAIQTPLKHERGKNVLWFYEPPGQVFFRGTVQVSFKDDRGVPQKRYFHLVQRQGEQGQPLMTLNMPPGDRRLVGVSFLYPPDATPPQALTIRTLESSSQLSANRSVNWRSNPIR